MAFGKREIKPDETTVDPKTGEYVHRINLPEKFSKDIEEHFLKNNQHAGNFMNLARNIVGLVISIYKEYQSAAESEKMIEKTVVSVRENMGLDSSWIYNVPLKKMEKRVPPSLSDIPNAPKGE